MPLQCLTWLQLTPWSAESRQNSVCNPLTALECVITDGKFKANIAFSHIAVRGHLDQFQVNFRYQHGSSN